MGGEFSITAGGDYWITADTDVLAFMSFPKAHHKQIHSTNPLERLNAEIKRRTDVVGIFPNEAAITRLAGALLLEQSDEWSLQRRYMQLEGLQTLAENQTARLKALAAADFLECLERMQKRGVIETAHKVKTKCSEIMRYAVATRRAERDPVVDLKGALPSVKHKHYATITYPSEVGALLRAIDGYRGKSRVVECALRLLPLVFVRSSELRYAKWDEFDLNKAQWKIPGERMKMDVPHIVPLSKQAVTVLRELHPFTGPAGLLFPSVRTVMRAISENTINSALRRMGYTKEERSVSSRALSIAVSIALAFASSVAADPADMSNPKHAATVIQMLARDDAQAELVDRGIPVSEAEKIKVAATRLEESLLQMSLKHAEEVCRNGDRYVRDPVALAAEYDRLENEQAAIRAREVAKLRAEAPIAWAAAVVDAGNNVDIEEDGRSIRGGDLIRSGRVTSAFAVERACNGYEILRDKAK